MPYASGGRFGCFWRGTDEEMKIIEKIDATASLADYATHSDMETVALSEDRGFIELIERSRSRVQAEGGVSGEEMRRRFPG